jgi:hypothetical protein
MNPQAIQKLCRQLSTMPESTALTSLRALCNAQSSIQMRVDILRAALNCRAWSAAFVQRIQQFAQSFGAGVPTPALTQVNQIVMPPMGLDLGLDLDLGGGCGCKTGTMSPAIVDPSNIAAVVNLLAARTGIGQEHLTKCMQYSAPDVSPVIDGVVSGQCEAPCAAGEGLGLQRVPFELLNAAVATDTVVTFGFERRSRLIAVTHYDTPNWDPDSWSLSTWTGASKTQVYDRFRNGTSFAALNPDTVHQPMSLFLESGDDGVSAILHRQNYLPAFISAVDIDNTRTVGWTYHKILTAAPETTFGLAWVLFY